MLIFTLPPLDGSLRFEVVEAIEIEPFVFVFAVQFCSTDFATFMILSMLVSIIRLQTEGVNVEFGLGMTTTYSSFASRIFSAPSVIMFSSPSLSTAEKGSQ